MLIITYIFNLLDYLFTCYWISKYGIEIEFNPFGRWLYNNNLTGFFKIVVVGALLALLNYTIKMKPNLQWLVYVLLAIYTIVLLIHIGIFIYIKTQNR